MEVRLNRFYVDPVYFLGSMSYTSRVPKIRKFWEVRLFLNVFVSKMQ